MQKLICQKSYTPAVRKEPEAVLGVTLDKLGCVCVQKLWTFKQSLNSAELWIFFHSCFWNSAVFLNLLTFYLA